MRPVPPTAWRLAAGTLTVALFAACTTSPTTAPSTPSNQGLSQPEANAVAEVVATDAAALPAGAAFDWAFGVPFAPAPMLGAPAMATASVSCTPTRTPSPVVDTDKDGVPDSLHVDFTGCSFTGGTFTLTLSGAIDLVDPTPTVADRAFRTRYDSFTRSLKNSTDGSTRTVVENGVREVLGTATSLLLSDTMQTDYTFATGAKASHVRKWASTFTADQGQTIQMGWHLPSGTWNISGSSSWTSGTNSYALSVKTTQPLHFNASCTVEPRFDAGTLTIVVTKSTTTTTVTIQFTACGQYTVTRS